jgi:predicted transcriptional regulator
MIKPAELRAAFLKWPATYRAALLSDDQLVLYRLVKKHFQITSAEVAAKLDISVQSASTRLNTLKKKGYLCRMENIAASGGKEFAYFTED